MTNIRNRLSVGMLVTCVAGMFASMVQAEPRIYTLSPAHSQVVFHYDHAGFSRTFGLFGGVEGEIRIDRQDLANASVTVTIEAARMFTGDAARDEVLLHSGQFFDLGAAPMITFVSTSVTLTGGQGAKVFGDLSLNGVTVPIVLDAVLSTESEAYPFPPFAGQPAVGFNATVVLSRSAFGLGLFVPFIADEISVDISIEAVVLP